jgi:hypothetical protein
LLALANLMLALAANRRYAYQIDWRIMPLRWLRQHALFM